MSQIFKPLAKEIYLDWIEQLISVDDKLSVWETNFITDLQIKLGYAGFEMTENQHNKLEMIYAEKT